MEFIFWILIFFIIYCYILYPVLITLIARLSRNPIDKRVIEPTVSVIIAAHNEEDVIKGKIENIFSLAYPKEKIEILVGSDGSDDSTVELLNRIADLRLTVFDFKERRGKMAVINDLVKRAKGEVFLFTDARQKFNGDAINQMVANFADPKIGCVSGELIFFKKENATAKGVSLYWQYEKYIRRMESAVHSMLGATGAIYAIRSSLYPDLPEDIILDDMYVPLRIIQRGYRAVFDESAKAFDEVAGNPKEEHRRKVRTLAGNYQLFGKLGEMFNPFKSPIAIQLFSHKLLRLLIPFFLITLFLGNLALLNQMVYRFIFIAQCIFYLAAIIGFLAREGKYGMMQSASRVTYVPYVFCLLNYSALLGFLSFIKSEQKVTWQKARR